MDFPVDLNRGSFVNGSDEFLQVIDTVLKNPQGAFLQSIKLGSQVAVHTADRDLVRLYIEETIAQLNNVEINNLVIDLPNIEMVLSYKGDLYNYKYSL